MVTLAQELAIANILDSGEPLFDTISTFLESYIEESFVSQLTTVSSRPRQPLFENIIRKFNLDLVRQDLAEISYKNWGEYEES